MIVFIDESRGKCNTFLYEALFEHVRSMHITIFLERLTTYSQFVLPLNLKKKNFCDFVNKT